MIYWRRFGGLVSQILPGLKVGDKAMKQLLKIIGLGVALWALSLIWLELNILLLWPLFAGLVAGMVPAYFLGRWLSLSRTQPSRSMRAVAGITRPTHRSIIDPAIGPTRPSLKKSPRERAAAPTRPMPIWGR